MALHDVLVYFGARTDPERERRFDAEPMGWARWVAVLLFYAALAVVGFLLLRKLTSAPAALGAVVVIVAVRVAKLLMDLRASGPRTP